MKSKPKTDNKKELRQQFYDAIFAQLDPASVDVTNENLIASVNAASKMVAKSVKRVLKAKKVQTVEATKPKTPKKENTPTTIPVKKPASKDEFKTILKAKPHVGSSNKGAKFIPPKKK